MTSKVSRTLIIILSIAVLCLTVLNISFALYSNSKETSGIIQFHEQKLEIEVLNGQSVVLETDDLTPGSNTVRHIKISNPLTSTSCVVRFWVEFKVEGKLDANYLSLNVADANNYTKASDGKIYYNKVLNAGASINDLELSFLVNIDETQLSNYEGKKYNMKLCFDSVQANRQAIESLWTENNYPADWYESLNI